MAPPSTSRPSARPLQDHDQTLARAREWLRTGLWFIPTLFVSAAIAAALALTALDDATGGDSPRWLVFGRGPEGAREVLGTIAGSTLAFTGVVFSITIVALQLASTQFSPRVLRTFLRDRGSQVCLGVFVATFVFALMVLREIDSTPGYVPGLSVTGAFSLVVASLFAFVWFVNHIAQAIRVVNIIESVARETRAAIDNVCPEAAADPGAGLAPPAGPPTAVLPFTRQPGALLGVDEDDLVEVARRHDCVLVLLATVGDYLPTGLPLFAVHGGDGTIGAGEVLPYVGSGPERTMYQDAAFGFRQLVDIAEKALSPAVNDPTTAVQVIDRIHDLLRRLAARPFPSGRYLDAAGRLRLVVAVTSWDDYVSLAFDEIRLYGSTSVQIPRRLRAALEDLSVVAPPGRRGALDRQRRLLAAVVARSFADEDDRRLASRADQQGLGS